MGGLRQILIAGLVLVQTARAGVGTMSSTPLWNLSQQGGARQVSSTKPLEVPNSVFPNFQAFTVEAKVTFGPMVDRTGFTLFDQVVGTTGWGLTLVRDANSGSPIYFRCGNQSYNCAQALGSVKEGDTHTFTIAVRDGWVAVYMNGVLKKSFMTTITPNLAPLRIGSPKPSGWTEMSTMRLASLKVWGEGEKFYAQGESQSPASGYVVGNGWMVEAPVDPIAGAPNLLYVGDSISEGYKSALKTLLAGRVNLYHWSTFIYSPGVANVPSGKIAEIGRLASFDHVVFNNGLHSLHWTADAVPDETVVSTYRVLAQAFRTAAPRARLHYLATTPHTGSKNADGTVDSLGDLNPIVVRLNTLARQMMESEGVAYVDAYSLLVDHLDLAAGDHYHWTSPAYQLLAGLIADETGLAPPRVYVGTDGLWNRRENWWPAGIPAAGSSVSFTNTVTLTGNVALPGIVTLDVASNANVYLQGTVSGAGGFVKEGLGKLFLSGNNSFTGKAVVSNGCLYARSWNALGDNAFGAVEIHANNPKTELYFGGVHLRKPLVLHNMNDPGIGYNSYFRVETGTTNVVSGVVSVLGHYLRMLIYEKARLDFTGGGSFGSNSAFLNRRVGSEIHVIGKPMSIVNRYNSDLRNGWLVFDTPGCSFTDVSSASNFCVGDRRVTVDGALDGQSVMNGESGHLDLCGTSQNIKRLFGRRPANGGSVMSERPGRLTLTDTSLYTNTCAFMGQSSLTLTGASAQPVVLTGRSTSSGTLTVDAGKMVCFAAGGSWKGGIVVKGTLMVEDAASVTNAAFVDVVSGGSLSCSAPVSHYRDYRKDGVSQIAVTGIMRTYVGTDGRWNAAANWSPSGVPKTGDTITFTTTATISDDPDLPGGVTWIKESASDVKVTVSGTVSGAGASLVHAGPGMLLLTGTNTFTGAFSNLTGTVKIPFLAKAGDPSPIGAGVGSAALIYNNGIFHVTGAGTTDRPYHGGGSSQWNIDGALVTEASVSGRTWWRNSGSLAINALCTNFTALTRTDAGAIYLNCPTNTFSMTPNFSAGTLSVTALADAGLPSSIGIGSSLAFGQSGYITPTTFIYAGLEDATCNRAFTIRSCEKSTSTYANRDGLTISTLQPDVTARYTGSFALGNSAARNPFLKFDGAGNVEVTTAIPHRFHIWKDGTGTLTLGGENAATGICTVAKGRLDLNGSFAAGMQLDVRSGAMLGGSGMIHSRTSFAAGSILASGSAMTCGTLQFTAAPTFAENMFWNVKVGNGQTDCVKVQGDPVWPVKMTIRLSAPNGAAMPDGAYRIMAWSALPPTDFVLTGAARGCRLEKNGEGLTLVVSRNPLFHEPVRANADPFEVKVGPSEACRTLVDAQKWIRTLKAEGTCPAERPIAVTLAPGDYVLDTAVAFTSDDGGVSSAPVTYRADVRGTVRILGARPLDPLRFKPLAAEDPLRPRLAASVVERVRVADVGDVLPVTPPAWKDNFRTPPAPWLYLGGAFQEIARWPNRTSEAQHGWTTFTLCTSAGDSLRTGMSFITRDTQARHWNFSEGVWLHGYWGNTWYDEYVRAVSWNAATREMLLSGPLSYVPTVGTSSARRYVALNVAEELDAPGEWWLDRTARKLYYLPAEGFGRRELVLTSNTDNLLTFESGVHDLIFENLTFAYAYRAFAAKSTVTRLAFEGCDFHSFQATSSIDGTDCRIRRCTFRHLGQGGIGLNGGSRQSLERARNLIEDCSFIDFERCQQTYAPAVALNGCGQAVRFCTFGESAHEALGYDGNEHLVGWNEFYEVLRESEDCGAIYTGRNTSTLGTQIIGNHFRDMRTGNVTAIYFDDCDWGDDAIGNTFTNVYRAFLMGGGNLHRLLWNRVDDCDEGFHVDRRGIIWKERQGWLNSDDWQWKFFANLKPDRHPWTAAYPDLLETLATNPREPWNNVIAGNLLQNVAHWTTMRATLTSGSQYEAAAALMTVSNNVTASTKGMSGCGIPGFSHLARGAQESDVVGFSAAKTRIAALANASPVEVRSPDSTWCVRVGVDVTGRLAIRADVRSVEVLGASPIGVTVDGVDYGRLMKPCPSQTVAGDGFVESTIPLESVVDGATNAQVEVRTANDGLAYRMCVKGTGTRTVVGETARWNLLDGQSIVSSEIPTNAWTAQGIVTTMWHRVSMAAPVVTNGILYIDVEQGRSRTVTPVERDLLVGNLVTGVVKVGDGTLDLASSLTGYEGPWGISNGFVNVKTSTDAFGTGGSAPVTVKTVKGSGDYGLTFSSSAAIDRPITIVCDDYRTMLIKDDVTVRFLRKVTAPGTLMRFDVNPGARGVFAGGIEKTGSLWCVNRGGTMVVENVPVNLYYAYVEGACCLEFNCPSNAVNQVACASSGGGRIILGCDDAFAGKTNMLISDTRGYRIDLNGHNLEMGRFGAFTSGELTASAPARLVYSQTSSITNANCAVTGALTLCKKGTKEFALSRVVTSTGGLEVTEGVFRMTRNSSWQKASHVAVSGTGRLVIEGDDPFGVDSRIRVSGAGVIEVASGARLTCGELKTSGGYLRPGVYRAGVETSWLKGAGSVKVLRLPGTMLFVR